MVVEVFISQRQGKNALGEQLLCGELAEIRIAVIGKAAGKLRDYAGDSFSLL